MTRHSRRKSSRRDKRSTRGKRSGHAKRGGGFSLDPSKFVSAGNLENLAYTGVGKDCVGGSFVRPGFINSGVPGMRGGKRRSRGGYQLTGAPVLPVDSPVHLPSSPGFPPHAQQAGQVVIQKGGRYESNVGALLDGGSDIGMKSYAGAGRIACEGGFANQLNMHGGAVPTVAVGGVDAMRVNGQPAGYSPSFQTFPGVSAVGGLLINNPYPVGGFNQACSKTGGGSVADDAAPYSPLQVGQIAGRSAFDGSGGQLPMKYGGKRRTRHKHSRRCKHHKHSSRRK